jgi:MFS family permease
VAETTRVSPPRPGPAYPWTLVGLLWFCGSFNYADRQAVSAVFPLLEAEFGLFSKAQKVIVALFMVVDALSGPPLAGFVVDRASRRLMIAGGLGFWSLIAAGTGLAQSFGALLAFRVAEGRGSRATSRRRCRSSRTTIRPRLARGR